LTGALHFLCIAVVATTTSIILISNKIQNGDILVPTNPVSCARVAVKTYRENSNMLNVGYYCELGVSKSTECDIFPFSSLTLLVGRQEGHPACRKLDFSLLVMI